MSAQFTNWPNVFLHFNRIYIDPPASKLTFLVFSSLTAFNTNAVKDRQLLSGCDFLRLFFIHVPQSTPRLHNSPLNYLKAGTEEEEKNKIHTFFNNFG